MLNSCLKQEFFDDWPSLGFSKNHIARESEKSEILPKLGKVEIDEFNLLSTQLTVDKVLYRWNFVIVEWPQEMLKEHVNCKEFRVHKSNQTVLIAIASNDRRQFGRCTIKLIFLGEKTWLCFNLLFLSFSLGHQFSHLRALCSILTISFTLRNLRLWWWWCLCCWFGIVLWLKDVKARLIVVLHWLWMWGGLSFTALRVGRH